MKAGGRLVFVAYAAGAEQWLSLLRNTDHSIEPRLRLWPVGRSVARAARQLYRDLDAAAVGVVFASRRMLASLQTTGLDARLAARGRAGMDLVYVPLDGTATEEAVAAVLPGASRMTVPLGPGAGLDERRLAMRAITARIASSLADDELELVVDRPKYFRLAPAAAWPVKERPVAYPMPTPAAEAAALPASADEGEDDVRETGRVVNTWFESDAPLPPFVAGDWYWFCVQIGWPVAGVAGTTFVEPDFGSHDVLELQVALFSRDFDVAQGSEVITLPRTGSSSLFRTRVRPRNEGACRVEVVLSLARELDVLQSLGVVVTVEAAIREAAAAGMSP